MRAGANPINPSLEDAAGVPQLLDEYYEFGTNQYIRWLLNQHLGRSEIPQFIRDVSALDIFNATGIKMFNEAGHHPAHAFLTCGNKEMVRQFLQKYSHSRPHLLTVKDATGRTALQIASQNRDFESVEILLQLYASSK